MGPLEQVSPEIEDETDNVYVALELDIFSRVTEYICREPAR